LRLRARLEGRVDVQLLSYFHCHILALEGLETWGFHANCVCAGNEVRGVVLSGVVGHEGAIDTSRRVDDGHFGGYNDASGLVGNGPENAAQVGLRKRRQAKHQNDDAKREGPYRATKAYEKTPLDCNGHCILP
jgi:hypothetical protein